MVLDVLANKKVEMVIDVLALKSIKNNHRNKNMVTQMMFLQFGQVKSTHKKIQK
jgi:hypothetical protein